MSRRDPANVVGLVPAAGRSIRLAPLPCSKELFPIGFGPIAGGHELRPKPVCLYLLEAFRVAGVDRAFIVVRDGKWDIPAYLRNGKLAGLHLAYLVMDLPYGPPFTLDQAYGFLGDATVVFGFPDIVFRPESAFARLLERLDSSGADVVLGLFPAHAPARLDTVGTDETGRVTELVLPPGPKSFAHTWMCAVWSPAFTGFLHAHVAGAAPVDGQEWTVGHVLRAAVAQGLHVDSVRFADGTYVDIGTPEDLLRAARLLRAEPEADHE